MFDYKSNCYSDNLILRYMTCLNSFLISDLTLKVFDIVFGDNMYLGIGTNLWVIFNDIGWASQLMSTNHHSNGLDWCMLCYTC